MQWACAHVGDEGLRRGLQGVWGDGNGQAVADLAATFQRPHLPRHGALDCEAVLGDYIVPSMLPCNDRL